MFAPSWLTRSFLVLAVFLFAVAVGCQKQADPDAKSEATAKSRQVTVDVTGMS